MKLLFFIKHKKVTAEADRLLYLMQEKSAKQRDLKPETVYVDWVYRHMQVPHDACSSVVCADKRLAAAFAGMTAIELLKPNYPNERRNRSKRNKLTPDEEELLHNTRSAIRTI